MTEGYVEVPAADEEVRMGGAAAGLEREHRGPDRAPGGESDNEMDDIYTPEGQQKRTTQKIAKIWQTKRWSQ